MNNWIDVKERLPDIVGWYMVKIGKAGDECEVPYSKTLKGDFVWVVPDPSMITHWKQLEHDSSVVFKEVNDRENIVRAIVFRNGERFEINVFAVSEQEADNLLLVNSSTES